MLTARYPGLEPLGAVTARRTLAAGEVCDMELRSEAKHRMWSYSKVAGAIEDTPQDLGLIYQTMERRCPRSFTALAPWS